MSLQTLSLRVKTIILGLLLPILLLASCSIFPKPTPTSTTTNTPTQTLTPTLTPILHPRELQWRWQNPLPDGNTLNSVWCSSPTDVFAVGANGIIKHYDGSIWSEMTSGTVYNLRRVWGSSSSDVYAVGGGYDYATKQSKSVILHYNGNTWQSMDYGISEYYLQGVWGSSSTDVFVSGGNGEQGVILHYDGSSWNVMMDQLSGDAVSIWGTSSSDVFAVINQYIATSEQYVFQNISIIFHYDGESWSEMTRNEIDSDMRGDTLRDIWGSSATDIYAVGERIYTEDTESHNAVTTVIYHYDGNSWSSTTSVTGRLYGVWGTSSSNIFAIIGMQGREDILLHFDGNTWQIMEHDFGNYLLGISGTSPSDVFLVGYGGLISHFDGNGNEWIQMSGFGTTTNTIHSIWGSSETNIYAVGGRWDYPEQKYHSIMLHFDGNSWNKVESETDRYHDDSSWGTYNRDIWGTSSNDIFYVGCLGKIHHYDGSSWSLMNSGAGNWIYGIWGSSSSDVFAVGQQGLILHFDGNSNNQWTSMTSGTNANLNKVWGSSSTDVFAIGVTYDSTTSHPIILHYNGTSWSEMDSRITVGSLNGVWGSASNDVFVVGGDWNTSNVILHYDGSSWSKMDNDASVNILYGVWGSTSSNVYAIGNSGGVLHYDGESWSEIVSGTPLIFSTVWGTSSTDIFAAGQGGIILHYSR